ncbi:MAG: LacI family DNA-binding transcriptional regulator [Puniceicoccaceae bacterium]
MKRITTRDIAKHIGMHYTTVAEALRNSPRISEKTKKRVSEAAKELGYKPDPILAALNAYRCSKKIDRRSATIAWINTHPTPEPTQGQRGIGWECYCGAKERVEELGYKLENFWLQNPRMTDKRATSILIARGIKGVLIPPLDAGVQTLEFDWEKFSAVRLGHSLRATNLPSVTPDQVGNTITLFKFLVRSGFKRIGLACPRWINQRVNFGFAAGFLGAHQEYLPDHLPAPLFQEDLNEETKPKFLEWVREYRFDALVLHQNDDYESVLKEAGIRVPEDLSLAWTSLFSNDPDRCGIHEDGKTIGRQGIDLIVAMLNRGQFGPSHPQTDLHVHGTLVLGKTLKMPHSGQILGQ